MGKYNTFKYGSGVLYGSKLPVIQLWKVDNNDPDKGVVARHIKTTLHFTGSGKFTIGTIRLHYARKQHVIPKWWAEVGRNLKRTKVTLNYSGSDLIRVDSVRLKQMIRHRRPVA